MSIVGERKRYISMWQEETTIGTFQEQKVVLELK